MNDFRTPAAAAATIVLALATFTTEAPATRIFDQDSSSCTTVNCSSRTFGGTVNGNGGSAGPWTIEVSGKQGQCLRFEVTNASQDLETVIVGPNGTVWRNDDAIGDRPVVQFIAPITGWYTVSVSHWQGTGIEVDFILAYGNYSGPNSSVNCPGVTPPLDEAQIKRPTRKGIVPSIPGGPNER